MKKVWPSDQFIAEQRKAMHPHGHYVFSNERMYLDADVIEERNRAYEGYWESVRSLFGDPPRGRSALEQRSGQ